MPSHSIPLPDASWLRALRRRVRAWFDRNARDLPWRGRRRDPYAVWLSEIMLQQTQVETVKAYYKRFLAALPTIDALAGADEREVLRLWEGLGYYRRARHLHQAARRLVAEHGGRFPRDPRTLRRLPGIGRYTAGAVLSLAFDLREPILEANTLRLHCRLLAYPGNPHSAEGQRLLWAMSEIVLPRRGAGRFNEALMELGGRVCTPRSPGCRRCPAAALCEANRHGLQGKIPMPRPKPPIEAVRETAVAIRKGRRVLLLQRPEGRRWTGLWDFPRFPLEAETPAAVHRELIEKVRRMVGVVVAPGRLLATLSHGVTRYRIRLECREAEFLSAVKDFSPEQAVETRWLRPAELDESPLSGTGRKMANLLRKPGIT